MDNDTLTQNFLVKFRSAKQLRDWVLNYLDIDLPMGHIDPDSNSSPVEWMWEAYRTYRDNEGNKQPGFIVMSSRESYKTLSESILSVILMCHFRCTIAHLAAIESQASKAIEYVNSAILKIKRYADANGLVIDAQSKRKIALIDSTGNRAYVNIIIATIQGANSEHTNIFTIDEVDVMRFPKAYEEAQLIPAYDARTGQYPITIKTSTRKFAFGLMEKEINNAAISGDKLLRWNLIDITERCSPKRHRPDLPKEIRYVHPKLPLRNLSKKEWESLNPAKQGEYSPIEGYAGCAACPLLPVCQTRLAHRPVEDVGGLFKPIDYTIGQFRRISPDMAEAQLMCWKPSSTGLIYPKFESGEKGNILTISQAWEKFTGTKADKDITLNDLIAYMLSRGVVFDAGVDWGFRHAFAIIIGAQVMGEWWIVDSVAVPGLEFEQMIKLAEEVRDKYRIRRWYCDTNQPMFIAAFKSRKMPCPKFVKDILGGIEAVRAQIVDAYSVRRLKVFKHEANEFLLGGFRNHHFILDQAGNPTQDPDDEEYADIMDALRYIAQNLFKVRGKVITGNVPTSQELMQQEAEKAFPKPQYQDWMTQKLRQLAENDTTFAKGKSAAGGLFWDMSDPEE